MRNLTVWLILAGLLLAAALAVQHQSRRKLAAELASLRQQIADTPVAEAQTEAPRQRVASLSNAGILQRLAALEESVAQLARNSEYLMERGQLPLAGNKLGDLFAKFADGTASDRERLQTMRLLRRNGGFNDDAVMHALNWLQTSTNGNIREDILQQLDGVTNAAVRGPLLAMAANDPDPDVREQAIDNLRGHMNDPQVEAQLWKMVNDPDEDLREEAREGIVEGPMTDARRTALQQRALDANSSLDDRLLAWQALRERNQDAPGATAAFAEIAQSTQDPFERAKLLRSMDEAIDRATPNDAALIPILINALQDPNPIVRQPAANFARDFSADPKIAEWLRYVAQTDPDSGVRGEAAAPFLGR